MMTEEVAIVMKEIQEVWINTETIEGLTNKKELTLQNEAAGLVTIPADLRKNLTPGHTSWVLQLKCSLLTAICTVDMLLTQQILTWWILLPGVHLWVGHLVVQVVRCTVEVLGVVIWEGEVACLHHHRLFLAQEVGIKVGLMAMDTGMYPTVIRLLMDQAR